MVYVAFILRWFTGLVFLTSLLDKVGDWQGTVTVLEGYDLFPPPQVKRWAAVLVVWEGALTLALFSGLGPQWTSLIAAATYLGFAAVLVSRLMRGEAAIPCGCGGILGDQQVSWPLAWRNLLLAVVALVGLTSPIGWPAAWGAAALISLGLALLVWLVVTLYEAWGLVANLQPKAK